eukprot:CAMPEP_0201586196 /NCGR_PEP_ID=MMETSP0190_2-20130828/130096_1 /ASSEMBLY_ACC=CAM_ASM_000263 /TAXON_ID=37353 /ORGANISM="Rosalina sp." /LENGTH=35 /DNA_ID= /DNA_START= /DNA_END= /DNA_ORIENTATION=
MAVPIVDESDGRPFGGNDGVNLCVESLGVFAEYER